MVYQKEFNVSTKGFCDIIDITSQISDILIESKINQGVAVVFVTSSTAAITAIEYEPNLVKDFQEFMEKLIPSNKKYHHGATWGDDNGFSHLRASLIGPSMAVPVSKGKMTLGTWEQIVLCDFDSKNREREIAVKIVGE